MSQSDSEEDIEEQMASWAEENKNDPDFEDPDIVAAVIAADKEAVAAAREEEEVVAYKAVVEKGKEKVVIDVDAEEVKKRKEIAKRSDVWQHFTEIKDEHGVVVKAKCKYCKHDIQAHPVYNGTSAMRRHFNTCKRNPFRAHQGVLQVKDGASVATWKFDPELLRAAFSEMIIEDELLFAHGEKSGLHGLFEEYRATFAPSDHTPQSTESESPQSKQVGGSGRMMKTIVAKRMRLNNGSSSYNRGSRTELEKHLAEECEDDTKNFDILAWWKGQSSKFPILSRLAHDVLAIPISTVASESAFITCGRIMDDFRTSLTPFMVEALVCTQDWLRRATPTNIAENTEELPKLEEELIKEFKEKAIIENNASKAQVEGSKATTTTTTTKTKTQPSKSSKSCKSKVSNSMPT